MLYNASELSIDSLVQTIVDSEFKMSLVVADKPSFIDLLAKNSSYEDRHGLYGKQWYLPANLYQIAYGTSRSDLTGAALSMLTECRMQAVQELFYRWCVLGDNKTRAKSPFACKKFMEYLDSIGYLQADFLFLMAGDE